MGWRIEFEPRALKELETQDRQVQRRLLAFLRDRVAPLADPREIGEALRGPELGRFWKYRVGDWRLVCDIRAQQVGRRQGAERAAINAPMQGTAADLIKKAMIATSAWLKASGVKSKLILQVHDELVLEVPDDEVALIREQLPRLMAGVAQLSVPLVAEVGVGANWDEAH